MVTQQLAMKAIKLAFIFVLLSVSHVTGDNHEDSSLNPESSTETSQATSEAEPTETSEESSTTEASTPTEFDALKPAPVLPPFGIETMIETIKNVSEKLKETIPFEIPPKPVMKRSAPKFEKNSTTNCNSKNLPCPKSGFYRFNQSCTQFYECYFSPKCNKFISRVRSCPHCLKFNAQKMGCDLAENVPECTYPSENRTCTGPGLFPVPGDCHKYYNCSTSNITVETCPPGTAFNQKDRKCVQRVCKGEKLNECASGLTYAADKFSCRKFHFCLVNNVTVSWGCPSGHIFENGFCETLEKSKLNWEKIKKRLVKKRA